MPRALLSSLIEMLQLDAEARELAEAYIAAAVLTPRMRADAQHIAIATVERRERVSGNREMVREELLSAVDARLRANEPPETRAALERLVADGRSEREAKRLIASALLGEMHAILREGREYDPARYAAALPELPEWGPRGPRRRNP